MPHHVVRFVYIRLHDGNVGGGSAPKIEDGHSTRPGTDLDICINPASTKKKHANHRATENTEKTTQTKKKPLGSRDQCFKIFLFSLCPL